MSAKYDCFIESVLQRVQPEFAFITPHYAFDLPAELTWVLVRALVAEHGLTSRAAAQVVLDFCDRKGAMIPELLNSPPVEDPAQIEFCQ